MNNLKPISSFSHFNVVDFKIEIIFSFIYTMHYNGLVIFLIIFSIVNMVHELNYTLLTNWNHCSWVVLYIYHNLLKHMNQFKTSHLYWNELMIFHIFSMFNMCTCVEPFIFNMLKLLFTSCILDLLKYIEIYVNYFFAIILEWFSEFFHISWSTNIYTWVQSSTLNQLKSLLKYWKLHLLIYIETHNNLILHVYTWTC
jgi:hypothetical protein